MLEPLLDGYGGVPESLDWYLADRDPRRASPTRSSARCADWPARVEATLGRC